MANLVQFILAVLLNRQDGWDFNDCFLKIKQKTTDFESLHKSFAWIERIYRMNYCAVGNGHKTKFIDPDIQKSFFSPIFQSNPFLFCFHPNLSQNLVLKFHIGQFRLQIRMINDRKIKISRDNFWREKKWLYEIFCRKKLHVDSKKSPCQIILRTFNLIVPMTAFIFVYS